MSLKAALLAHAQELGFDLCRVTHAGPPGSAPQLLGWLDAGRHGEMAWLARNAPKRADPRLVLPGARAIVVVATSYAHPEAPSEQAAGPRGVVARYAHHADYHEVMGRPLRDLATWLDAQAASRSLWYVDTGPVLERDLAQRAGLGFIGKHTSLISRRLGNWFLLGEILTTAELAPDVPEPNRCGSCSRCLPACPTAAITAPFQLDARRCISYLTIELKGAIPEDLRPLVGNRIFGCDDCLAVCPWNRFARAGRLMTAAHRPDLEAPALLDLLALDDAGFKRRFAGTPMLRAKRRGLLRNVCVALGNVGGTSALPALQRATADPELLVAEHARWAITRIEQRN
ncbi:MAG TPA: tRNA epoxyqueuosine(34) reductase QueG [Verrucomicrobiota bacterium]|nr:tRNA epoxyqueuosine(34) reductase QueG [Verrucomicrobiota bacterium]